MPFLTYNYHNFKIPIQIKVKMQFVLRLFEKLTLIENAVYYGKNLRRF